MSGRSPFRALALALALPLVAAPAPAAEALCNDSSVLTLLATDTREGELLFALTGGDVGAFDEIGSWLLRLSTEPPRAMLYPDILDGSRLGASLGPGPFLAAHACGEECLQPVSWSASGWSPLGLPLYAAADGSVHLTRERGGAPWVTIHRATGTIGLTEVRAWRLDGDRWVSRGALNVQAVGSPAAQPDLAADDLILVGTGRFSSSAPPDYWLSSLPSHDEKIGSQLQKRADTALYLTHDSRLFSSRDGGGSWLRERWAPWPTHRGSVEIARAGTDYWVDTALPLSWSTTPFLWFDDRMRDDPNLRLTRRVADGSWREEARIERGPKAPISIDHVLHLAPGRWLLLGPCRRGRDGNDAVLTALEVGDGAVSPLLEIPIRAGWRR